MSPEEWANVAFFSTGMIFGFVIGWLIGNAHGYEEGVDENQ